MDKDPGQMYLMVGYSSSGKTKLVRDSIRDQTSDYYNLFSLNRLRIEWAAQERGGNLIPQYPFWDEPTPEHYATAFNACISNEQFNDWCHRYNRRVMHDAADYGTRLYVDNMNLTRGGRRRIVRAAHKLGIQVTGVFVDTDYETCLERNAVGRRLDRSVMESHRGRMEPPSADEFDALIHFRNGVLVA